MQESKARFRLKILPLTVVLLSLGAALITSQMSKFASATTTTQGTPSPGVYFDHLVVIMLENEGIADICGGNPPPCNGPNTPYLSNLANTYGIGQQYLALIQTSWPDYYGILGASTYGCPTNCYPPPGSVTATNLVDRFEANGITWKGYFENQGVPAGCATSDNAPYTYIHNGFVLFQDITSNPSRCNNLVLANPSGCAVADCALINDLNSGSAPNFMWLTPNDCNDMRSSSNCSNGCTSGGSTTCIVDGDNYLKSLVPNILSSSTFQNERSALFITFDEGNGYCPVNQSTENCVYAVWAGRVAKTSFFTPTKYNHYSLTKTIEVNWNLTSITSNDANATPMTEFFTSTPLPPPLSASFTYGPSNPTVLQSVTFNASATGGTQPYSYGWNFGDGSTGSGQTESHTYLLPGTYSVSLTVDDAIGAVVSTSQTVTVSPPLGL